MVDAAAMAVIDRLLAEAQAFLERHGERNWIRGIAAARNALRGDPPDKGYADARSIYRTMARDGRNFSEYNVWDEAETVRLRENAEIDRIRAELWHAFDL